MPRRTCPPGWREPLRRTLSAGISLRVAGAVLGVLPETLYRAAQAAGMAASKCPTAHRRRPIRGRYLRPADADIVRSIWAGVLGQPAQAEPDRPAAVRLCEPAPTDAQRWLAAMGRSSAP